MAKIQLLDQKTIDNIAAGKLLNGQLLVVKRLWKMQWMQKAKCSDCGDQRRRNDSDQVTDNGIGIQKDQVKTAFYVMRQSKDPFG